MSPTDPCGRCQSHGLPCGIKTLARHVNDGAGESVHLGTQNQYLSTLTPETSRNFQEEIEDRTDGVTGLLQLPVLKDRKTGDGQDKSQLESRSTAKEGEGLTRQHLVLKSNLNPAKSEELPPKLHIKTESGYSESSRVESSPSDVVKVKIEDLDSGSEYEENGKDPKPSRKKARIFKEGDTATDIAYWKARVKNSPFDYRNWDSLVFAYQREFKGMTTNETSSSREGISSNIP